MSTFKARLSAIKKRKRFVFGSGSRMLARELIELLDGLKQEYNEPRAALEAIASFYKSDKYIFERCDDSGGYVGDVYRGSAADLFVTYARDCADKKWIGDLIFKLELDDVYGVRSFLLDRAAEFLPESVLRSIVDKFWEIAARQAASEEQESAPLIAIESLAKQLKDPALYERAARAWPGVSDLSIASRLEIAELHLRCGNTAEALKWAEQVPLAEEFMAEERDDLLVQIHKALGDADAVRQAALRRFRGNRVIENFEQLISVVGEEKRPETIVSETAVIHATEKLSYVDAGFLVHLGMMDDAEDYLTRRLSQFRGDYDYDELLYLAGVFEKQNRLIITILIYRALLEAILAKSKAKIYHHGVKYLRKLDSLAEGIRDWRGIKSHAYYKAGIREANKLKYSFWSEYDP